MKRGTAVSLSVQRVKAANGGLPAVAAAAKALAKASVYIGIPKGADGDSRRDDKRTTGGPANCVLGWIHEKGSPAANIPARPFLIPGVKSAEGTIRSGFNAAGKAALAGDIPAMDALLERTGIQTVSAVKNYLQTADLQPLKLSTIENRFRSRATKTMRPEEMPGADHSGIRPLVNTGSLRDALQHMVVKESLNGKP